MSICLKRYTRRRARYIIGRVYECNEMYATNKRWNVPWGRTYADNIHNEIIHYPPTTGHDSNAFEPISHHGEALYTNKQESAESRGYFSATMFIRLVLGGGTYRALHEMILFQALK